MSVAALKPAPGPYGFRMTIERTVRGVPELHTFPSKTSAISMARQAARYKAGFIRLVSAEPLSQPEFLKEFAVPGATRPVGETPLYGVLS